MATMNALIDRARLELGDRGAPLVSSALADGSAVRFELAARPVADDLQVSVIPSGGGNPVLQVLGVDYQLDTAHGIVTFANPPAAGATVYSIGTSYRYFSDVDWTTYVNTAYLQHNHGRPGTLATLDPVEDYLVVLLAVCEALYTLLNDSAFDIDIATPEGISIPRHQRFDQLLHMLMTRQDQYNRLASALNVGLNRIEMFTLRRVSRATGRLVPLYVEQEVEDTTSPVRSFVPIDRSGAPLSPDTVPDTTLNVIVGEVFTQALDLGMDVTGKQVKVTLRKYKDSAAYRWFAVSIDDAVQGLITITLDTALNWALGGGPYWWDARVITDVGHAHTVMEGPVLVEQRPRTV